MKTKMVKIKTVTHYETTNPAENPLLPKITQRLFRLLLLSAVSPPKPNQGVTLLEIVIAAVITGIIAAIGTPSLMGILQGDQVKQGVDQIHLALQDAQKQAVRHSKKCTIMIEKKSDEDHFSIDIQHPTLTTNQGCLGGVERDLPETVEVVMTSTIANGVPFSFKGTTTEMGTIVVRPKKGKGQQRCLVISNGLGIMRTGIYEPTSSDASISADNCKRLIKED